MAQFILAYQITMHNEGGYANNPNDSGGETYAGIAKNYWPSWPGWPTVDSAVAANIHTVNQTLAANSSLQAMVQAFYKTNFWDPIALDQINDQQVGNQLFDTGVNMGVGIGSRFLQQAVNVLKPGTLTVDGQVGPLTISAANSLNGQALYNAICQLRKARYEAIIAANPSQEQFRNSWFSRMPPYQA